MIRPITLVCWVMALCAGLYLYRAKHEVELIDQHIDQIAKQTAELRIESRSLLDEWIRLGQPEQLHKYSDEYLGLQPISPSQFARMNDLAARLPATQPDPPDEQANVVAQSADGTSAEVPSPDVQSPGDRAGAIQIAPAEAATAETGRDNVAGTDEIPVPPIPPPAAVAALPSAPALPLQARPVTPRSPDGQAEAEVARTRPVPLQQGADDPHVARVAPSTPAEPHQGPPGPISGQTSGQAAVQAHGLPALPAQGSRDASGMPPLQAAGPTREAAQGSIHIPSQGPVYARTSGQPPVTANGQPAGQPALRPAEPRTAENRPNEAPRETRPAEPPPAQRQAVEPRAQREPAQSGPGQSPAPQGGSLLGMSRGAAPLPLPAPTPVNANWSGPAGNGSVGSGR